MPNSHGGTARCGSTWGQSTTRSRAIDAGEIAGVRERHPAANDQIAQAVADEADSRGGREAVDDGVERAAVGLDRGGGAGIAEEQHVRVEGLAEVVGDRPHRRSSLAEPVEHDHGGAVHRRNRAIGLERRQRVAAFLSRALADERVARVEDAAAAVAGPFLQPPVVTDRRVAPLHGLL